MWVSAFGSEVWLGCLIIVVILAMLKIVTHACQDSPVNLQKGVENVIFAVCAIHVRQSVSSKYLSKLILVALLFTSFVLLAMYEFYLTTNLIKPPSHKKLCTLREFFANDYTLVYQSSGKSSAIKAALKKEFARKRLGNFSRHKTIAAKYYWITDERIILYHSMYLMH